MTVLDTAAAVIGGGPAGLAAAIAFARHSRRPVLVADAGPAVRERVGEGAPPDLLLLLGRLGLAERFQADGHAPCPGNASLWGGERVGFNDFIVNPLGPAWRLDRRRFDALLTDAASGLGAALLWNTRYLRSQRLEGGGFELLLAGPDGGETTVRAGLVIDAGGHGARFSRDRGAVRRVDDEMLAIVRFDAIAGGDMTMQTLLEARPEGWWYAARLPDGRVVSMLATDRAGFDRLDCGAERAWRAALAETALVGPALAGLRLEPERSGGMPLVRPIVSSLLDRRAGEGWWAVGEAASSYDPISAQGIYKGLLDGIQAGTAAAAWLEGTAPPRPERSPDTQVRFEEYCRNRAYLYGLERRWPDSPFWRQRRERSERALRALDAPALAG